MQAKQKQNENKFQLVYQKILKVKGGFEMKGTNHITDVTTWLPKGLKSKTVAKVLGGLAIGALMLTATGLAIETGQASDPVSNPASVATTKIGGGISDFEEPYVNAVRSNSDLGGGITDFEEPYVNAVRSSSDLGGGITDDEWMFISPYRQDFSNGSSAEVRVTPSVVQGIPDDEWMSNSPFHQDFSAVGKLGVETAAVTVQGITDFEEPYTSSVSSLPTQLVDIEDEGGTGRMFEPWEFSNLAGENEQANLFPEVEL